MENKKKSFSQRIFMGGIIPNMLSVCAMYFYSMFIMQTSSDIMIRALWTMLILALPAQFILAPFSNFLITKNLSKKIERWENSELSAEESFELFKEIQSFPRKKQYETLVYFVGCTILLALMYKYYIKVGFFTNLVSVAACLFGSNIAGIFGLLFSMKICSEYAEKIVSRGMDERYVHEKRTFGLTFHRSFLNFVVVPLFATTVLFISTFILTYMRNEGVVKSSQFIMVVFVALFNIIVSVVLVLFFFSTISSTSKKIQLSMEHIIKNDIFTVKLMPTDIANEITYNMYLINNVIKMFRSVFDKIQGIGQNIVKPVQDLTEIANETASTAYEQSAGVKEILATMEDNDVQTRLILKKITDVTEIASRTTENVEIGFETLRSNLVKMNEITDANVSTITGIRVLSEKIESIWEIVNIIKDISDQTRIIAFNAELEASGAGDAGKKFHIVANEIRRLAAGITDSVEQIRERITEIQHSSDNLIIASESGTERIGEGCQLTVNLESKFTEIKTSSEITSESANEIQSIIQQQSNAFDQIVATIREISSGIENISSATNTVNTATDRLKNAADRLENLHKEVVQ